MNKPIDPNKNVGLIVIQGKYLFLYPRTMLGHGMLLILERMFSDIKFHVDGLGRSCFIIEIDHPGRLVDD